MPAEIARIVTEVAKKIPGDRLAIHTHNDTENAVANSLAAVGAGARQVQGTLNGLGERCGNANLVAVIPAFGMKPELAARYRVHPNMITKWKRVALVTLKEGFTKGGSASPADREAEIQTLQAKIGELVVERDFLARAFDR